MCHLAFHFLCDLYYVTFESCWSKSDLNVGSVSAFWLQLWMAYLSSASNWGQVQQWYRPQQMWGLMMESVTMWSWGDRPVMAALSWTVLRSLEWAKAFSRCSILVAISILVRVTAAHIRRFIDTNFVVRPQQSVTSWRHKTIIRELDKKFIIFICLTLKLKLQ